MQFVGRLAGSMLLAGLLAVSATAGEATRFTAMDDTTIRVFFAERPVVWVGLPAEHARNFGRGKPLPRGIQVAALPRDLLARLPARSGFQYLRVGDDVAMIDKATRIVADVVENVFN